jgi:hypothetical protein
MLDSLLIFLLILGAFGVLAVGFVLFIIYTGGSRP